MYRAQRRFIGLAGLSEIWIILLRHGSNALDSSCSRERSSPVMLSAAKHLAADRDRPFASLRVTGCDESHCQGLFFTIEPCLICIIGGGRGKPAPPSALRSCAYTYFIHPLYVPSLTTAEKRDKLGLGGRNDERIQATL